MKIRELALGAFLTIAATESPAEARRHTASHPENLQNVEKTLSMLKNQMSSDLVSENNANDISNISKTALSSDKFFNSIKNDMNAIMTDNKITISDLPRMLSLLLKSQTYFTSLKNSVSSSEVNFKSVSINDILKYASLSLFYYLMLNDNANQDDLDSFLLLYPSLWSLVELSLPKHEEENSNQPVDTLNKKQKVNTGCC